MLSTVCCGCRCRSTLKVQRYNRNTRVNIYFLRNSQQKTQIFRWKMRRGKLHISWEIIFQHHFFFFLVHFPASWSREHPAGSGVFALTLRLPRRRSRCPGSGQWVNRWWCPSRSVCIVLGCECRTAILKNAQPPPARSSLPEVETWQVLFQCLHATTVFFHTDETLTHMSGFPVVWIVLQVKNAFRKKLDFSQSLWRSFLKDEDVTFDLFIYFFDTSMR